MKKPLKKTNWYASLVSYIRANQNTPFQWGQFDCCLFACNCVEVMTGIDPGAKYRGQYASAKGSLKTLKKLGGGNITTAFSAVFGPLKPRLNAGRGDLVLVAQNHEHLVGVMIGGQVYAASESGLRVVSFATIVGCWHIDNMEVT